MTLVVWRMDASSVVQGTGLVCMWTVLGGLRVGVRVRGKLYRVQGSDFTVEEEDGVKGNG